MKKRLLAIVNPISGVGRQKKIERLLQTNLNQDLYDYEVRYTERIHHGTELARQGADQGFDVITAVGGDGSVNDVIAGMHGRGALGAASRFASLELQRLILPFIMKAS